MGSNEDRCHARKYFLSPEQQELRLAKRLCYLLRYGAEKEGLKTSDEGFIELSSLLRVPLLRHHSRDDILQLASKSLNNTGVKRFETKEEHNQTYIRASYGRRMERNPCHEGSNVNRLLEICLNKVCNNLDDYDLTAFPDEFLINTMIHKMRQNQRLNNRAWRTLLVPVLENLDLGAVFLTEGTMKLIAQRCPHLKVLNMRQCSYIATDHVISNLVKRLKSLESINLSGCHHLTDTTLQALCKHCPSLRNVNVSNVPLLTQQGILDLLCKSNNLQHLDICENQNINEEGLQVLEGFCEQRKITIAFDGLTVEKDSSSNAEQNASLTLALAGVSNNW